MANAKAGPLKILNFASLRMTMQREMLSQSSCQAE